jgi:peroxiredoxin Q/BCP
MKRLAAAAALATALLGGPALADLAAGAKAPEFSAQAYLAGQPFTFDLAKARKSGPVVVYFFPATHTSGCNLEAHLFSEAIDQFKAEKATVIGITAGKVKELADFSKETEHCGGKFAVAADPGAVIARQYDLSVREIPLIDGKLTTRTSYVISPGGQIISVVNGGPDKHVAETLAAVKAYNARK